MARLNISIPDDLAAAFKSLCVSKRKSISGELREFMQFSLQAEDFYAPKPGREKIEPTRGMGRKAR